MNHRRNVSLLDMHQHAADMHQIENRLSQLYRTNVSPPDLEVRAMDIRHEARVNVYGQRSAHFAHTVSEPVHHRAGPRPHFQARPARRYSEPGKATTSAGVKLILNQGQSFPFVSLCRRSKNVARFAHAFSGNALHSYLLRRFRYADGRRGLRPEVDNVRVNLPGRDGIFTAIVELKRDTALIGAIVLEDLDFVVDCTAQRLVPRDPDYIFSEIE